MSTPTPEDPGAATLSPAERDEVLREAERRYPDQENSLTYPLGAIRTRQRAAFVAGVEHERENATIEAMNPSDQEEAERRYPLASHHPPGSYGYDITQRFRAAYIAGRAAAADALADLRRQLDKAQERQRERANVAMECVVALGVIANAHPGEAICDFARDALANILSPQCTPPPAS